MGVENVKDENDDEDYEDDDDSFETHFAIHTNGFEEIWRHQLSERERNRIEKKQ